MSADELPREFYDRPEVDDLGDPRTDPPGTMRVKLGDRASRYDPATPRVLRLPASPTGTEWVAISGPDAGLPFEHEEVASWPLTHWLGGYTVAMAKVDGPLQRGGATGEQRHERGDMDLIGAFREVADGEPSPSLARAVWTAATGGREVTGE